MIGVLSSGVAPGIFGVWQTSFMHEVVTVERGDFRDGNLISVGPTGGILGKSLLLPAEFSRIATLNDKKLKMTIHCEFVAERYEVKGVNIEALEGFVSTRDLTQLGIPRVIRLLAPDLIPDFRLWTAGGMQKNPMFEELKNDWVYLAQMYWMHSAVYGKPRIEIANALGISKSTSNVLLRRIEAEIPLPRDNSLKFSEVSSTKRNLENAKTKMQDYRPGDLES